MQHTKKLLVAGLLLSLNTLTAQATTYSVTDLGTLGGGDSYARGINAIGQVVGDVYPAGNGANHAFLYSNGAMQDLGTLGGTYSYATGINASGQVTGYSAGHAFLYSNGAMQDLGTLGGTYSYAAGINDSG
ncbi:hypothetical protein [Methylomonas koyamae]|nr:hypothetical protein [Methylomonas koyamae]BBL58575.1 hypothetical protein MKFW12EY_21880 [Methylomonas koyamae]